MMTPEKKYVWFEEYCNDTLDPTQKKQFETTLTQDKIFAEEFMLYKELHTHLITTYAHLEERKALTNTLTDIGNSYFEKQKTVQSTPIKTSKVIQMPFWLYTVAASIVIIFGIFFFTQKDATYSDYANLPILSLTERSTSNTLLKETEKAFNAKDFKIAVQLLQELLIQEPNNAQYQYYYGIALVEQNQHLAASKIFKELQSGTSVYQYEALWFEALNQLKQQHTAQCRSILQRIPETADAYTKAQELLEDL